MFLDYSEPLKPLYPLALKLVNTLQNLILIFNFNLKGKADRSLNRRGCLKRTSKINYLSE